MTEIINTSDYVKYTFANDGDNKRLKLLVILSPIFIASFDNGDYELSFLKKTIENSKFPYGLYPNFFEDFNLNEYFGEYENYKSKEDIVLRNDNKIDFIINPMDDEYIESLKTIIECLILDDNNRDKLLSYFEEIRDDIVINGRRSIIANGIQGFYLQKYVVVWMIDLCNMILDKYPNYEDRVRPIYNLSNNLKTPRTK